MGIQESLHPAVAGILIYVAAWMFWRSCLASARPYDADAEKRASALLDEMLSSEEREQLAESGYLAVASPSVAGRVYRIPARAGWVDVYERDELTMKLCALPSEGLPAADVVLMHKVMIQGNEQEYLRSANVRWMRQGRRGQ